MPARAEQPLLGALEAAPPRALAPPTGGIAQAQSALGGLPPERAGLKSTQVGGARAMAGGIGREEAGARSKLRVSLRLARKARWQCQ